MSESATSAATAAAVSSKVTYSGAGTSVIGYLASSEFAVLAGVVIALGGFCINWYYRHREDKRAQDEHRARMALLSQDGY